MWRVLRQVFLIGAVASCGGGSEEPSADVDWGSALSACEVDVFQDEAYSVSRWEPASAALGDFKAKGAEVVGVSMDPMDKHEEFCSAKDLKFKLLSDNDGKVSEAYGADLKIPILGKFSDRQTFLIDSSGVVKGHWLERDGSMANVKTPAHTSQILEAIDKL